MPHTKPISFMTLKQRTRDCWWQQHTSAVNTFGAPQFVNHTTCGSLADRQYAVRVGSGQGRTRPGQVEAAQAGQRFKSGQLG